MVRLVLLSLVLLPSLTLALEPGDQVVCIRSCDIKHDTETTTKVLLPGDRLVVRATEGKFVKLNGGGRVPSDCLIAAKDAAAHFRQRAKVDPSDIDARCGLAMELLEENKDDALSAIDAVVLRRETWITLERKACILASRKAMDDALAVADRALQLEPRRLQLRLLRGRLRLANDQPELALKEFEFVLGQQDSIDALRGRAMAWTALQQLEKALADFALVLERGPNNIDDILMRGTTLVTAGRPDDALPDIDAALRIDPNNARAFRLRGAMHCRKRQAAPAIAALNRALELEPDDSNALTIRALCWIDRGEPDKAIDDYTAAIKLSPEEAQHWGNRSHAWWMKKELPKSLADLNKAIELDPKSSVWIANRGAAHMEMGDYPAAIADLNQALAMDPKAIRARFRLAWIYACIPDDEVRSGETALKLLWPVLDSEIDEDEFDRLAVEAMAAAMAEVGNFNLAVKTQHGAIALANTQEETRAARERLTLYEAGKPYRLPVKRR
jgi:tetratricopeptide (TPR) repeat protein